MAFTYASAIAAGPYTLDGRFDDWTGAMSIADKSDDGASGEDIRFFYWGTNPNDPFIYFMIERYSDPRTLAGKKAAYQIHIDTNNNGRFDGPEDRIVDIMYQPTPDGSQVLAKITESKKKVISNISGNWGQSDHQGAAKVEARASFADLGIITHQAIRMYVTSAPENDFRAEDRLPDSGDVQFSPVPILDYPLLILATVGIVMLVWWKTGRFVWKAR
jgi:hypothetical protein